jgi:hypothetical protein
MSMYLFTIRSRIKPKSEAAEKLAKLLIRERGWIPEKTTDASIIQKKGLKTKKDKQFYAEAIKYGYSLVFNMWLKDAADADVDYEAKAK